jgi:penicillin V acylase-like amidase (Ntn superfamily)
MLHAHQVTLRLSLQQRRSTMNRKSVMQKRAQATKSGKPQTVAEKLAARSKRFIQLRKAERAGSKAAAFASAGSLMRSTSVAAPASSSEAPQEAFEESPWQAVHDEDSGATYYHNGETGETTWDAPPGFA